ncbi:MAG: ribonuclease H-like domain-containing protein [Lachnospiraceae bacterium]|nr:ribonuclease H-like domain-containing protein [Lachnospiraceae bacterium]
MKEIRTPIHLTQTAENIEQILGVSLDEIMFFDIETTGLSASTSSLYLIGSIYFENGTPILHQWFADDAKSEEAILHAFFTLLKNYRTLLHFNGTTFDIPYILQKVQKYNLSYNFDALTSIDLYQKARYLKKHYKMPSLKQKAIEALFGIDREDLYSGKELIQFYADYRHNLIRGNLEDAKEQERLLLLHNHDDLIGLADLSIVYYLPNLTGEHIRISAVTLNESHTLLSIAFELTPAWPIPLKSCALTLLPSQNGEKSDGCVIIPVINDTIKYFYENYKDYYYLPKEDTAIHKSVGQFVDKEFRKKANASNCYTKKEGLFIKQYLPYLEPKFSYERNDSEVYLEVTDAFLKDYAFVKQYVLHLLRTII